MPRRRQTEPSPSRPGPPTPAPRSAIWLRAAILIAAGALAYANSLSSPFIFDDEATVVENAGIRSLSPTVALFPHREAPTAGRPVVNVSFAINYALDGLDPVGYRIANIVIHLACGLLLLGIVRRTLELPTIPTWLRERSLDLACASALLWLVHPLNSEAVDYITQRTESMMALCYLATLYCAIRGWITAAIACCAIGMASKESMVTAPLIVVLYDRVFRYDSLARAWRERRLLYGGLSATWVLLALIVSTGPRVHSAGFSAGVSPWTYLLNQAVMIGRYLWLAIWPRPLVLMYGPPRPLALTDVLPQAMLVLALLAATVVALVKRPQIGFLGVWFFLTLAPTSTIVPIATEAGAERRMYLPLIALVAAAAVTIGPRLRKTVAVGLLLAVSAVLMVQTGLRNREYRSSLVMADTVLDRWPTGFSHALVGIELAKQERHADALPHLQQAVATYPPARFNLGAELFSRGDLDGAIRELQRFVQEQPQLLDAVSARTIIGRALVAKRQYAAAEEQLRLVLTMTTQGSDAYVAAVGHLADSLFGQEKFGDAAPLYRSYLASRPDDAAARRNYAMTLFNTGALDAAASEAQALLRLKPNDATGHDLLGRILASSGRLDEARAEFERAVRADPNDEQARADLALVLRMSAKRD